MSISRQTDLDGAFRFESLNSGKYTLSAQAGILGAWGPHPVEVATSSCSEVFPILPPHTTLSGTLTLEGGAPAKKQRVEVMRKNRSDVWYSTAQFWKQTDEKGQFQFKELPIGDYLVGYEIWSDSPSQDFRLSQPHTPRTVRVEVVWPDGTSPTEHLLQLFDGQNLIKNIGLSLPNKAPAHHQGVIEFKGYEERTYKLHARYWIDDLGSDVPTDQQRIAITEVKEVAAGKDISVRLVLSRRLLASEER